MLKLMGVMCVCLAIIPLFGQAQPKYEVGTIMGVSVHQGSASDAVTYDVSVKVGGTIYVVLYTPPLNMDEVKYAAGRELLVLVEEKTIKYNDILGRSLEVPIMSRKPASKETK